MPLVIVAAALIGLAVGSFLNVVIYRLPRGEPLSRPPSQCPNCGHAIRNRHNIPVVGWLLLRGRCRDCRQPISVRYPLVEFVTAALFVALAWWLADIDRPSAIPAYLFLAAIGVALAMIDFDTHRLPNAIVLPSYPVLAVLLAISAAIDSDWGALLRAVIGAISLYAFYFAIHFAYPVGMGFGDVKLAGLLGAALAYLSWPALAVGAFGAFLLGGLVGAVVILSRRGTGKTALPFGPFMIAATIVAIFVADPVWHTYTRLTLGA